MTELAQSPYLRAIKALLTSASLNVGGGVAPLSNDGSVVTPCVVLYLQPTSHMEQSIDRSGSDARITFRVIAVDRTDEGAAHQDDLARAALVGEQVTITGRASRTIRWESSSDVERDNDVSPPCMYVSSLYSLVSNES